MYGKVFTNNRAINGVPIHLTTCGRFHCMFMCFRDRRGECNGINFKKEEAVCICELVDGVAGGSTLNNDNDWSYIELY